MDIRVLCILLVMALSTSADPCPVDFESCYYKMTCYDYFDTNFDWSQFRVGSTYIQPYNELCEKTISYNGYRLFPLYLVYKQILKGEDRSQVPNIIGYGGDGVLNIIETLDLSENEYIETPIIRSMQNLQKLTLSKNNLEAAQLSNFYDLSMLNEIDLSYNNIKNITIDDAPFIYKRLTKVNISHNYLVQIPDAIFDEFDDLQTLDLSFNYINALNKFTFEGVKKLIYLNLANNRVTNINSALFRFSELKVLILSNNRLKEFNLVDIEKSLKLETLSLDSNEIRTINNDVFSSITLLKNLDLSNNHLIAVNKNAFSGLKFLIQIDLSKNKIEFLPKGLFQNTSLINFSIRENILTGSLESGMLNGINTDRLDFSHQRLNEIKDYAFYGLKNLRTLLLNNNNIHVLTRLCFETLTSLQQLDLSHNLIVDLGFISIDLSNLQSLLLQSNRLVEIKPEQFSYLANLEFLDLSENQLTSLAPGSFQMLRNLINFKMDSNPLVGKLEANTFEGLILIPSLDLSNNLLNVVSNGSFKDMIKLTKLNLSMCNISELQYNSFTQTGYIETLDLSQNKLTEFNVNTTHLLDLAVLLLNNNLLKTIASDTFRGLSRLNTIMLSNNSIENIHNRSLITLNDLRSLDLSYNDNLNFTTQFLEQNLNLQTLVLSGIKTNIDLRLIVNDSQIKELFIAHTHVQNISKLHLSNITRLDVLILSYNNISQLEVGDFTGMGTLRTIDLSFNHISFIQPGVFKDTVLEHLNISHNFLSFIGYGIFRGLSYLSVLDLSHNNIVDLQNERFYEVGSLTKLIVDNNKIREISADDFVGTSLTELSIGGNPLPCHVLVKLKKSGFSFQITAMELDEHSKENVDGVTCNKENDFIQPKIALNNVANNSFEILNALQALLSNVTYINKEKAVNDSYYLKEIYNILDKSNKIYEDKLPDLVNLTSKVVDLVNMTSKVVDVSKNTSEMIGKTMQLLLHSSVAKPSVNSAAESKPNLSTTSTTVLPKTDNLNQTQDIILYINKLKEELQNTIANQKYIILREIENKLNFTTLNQEMLKSKKPDQEKLVSKNMNYHSNVESKSYFTETCLVLILIILVGFILYKVYKSKIYIRNRHSISTRELPGAMEHSAL